MQDIFLKCALLGSLGMEEALGLRPEPEPSEYCQARVEAPSQPVQYGAEPFLVRVFYNAAASKNGLT